MENRDCNKDDGVITFIQGDSISVRVLQKDSCSSCMVAAFCEKTSKNGKNLTIKQNNASQYNVGEKVSILTPQNKVLNAIRLAFLYPTLLIIVVCLFQYLFFPLNDIMLALICVGFIVLYFIILYLNRNKSLFNFSIFIEKIDG